MRERTKIVEEMQAILDRLNKAAIHFGSEESLSKNDHKLTVRYRRLRRELDEVLLQDAIPMGK
jgi:hypothetical protein